MLYPSTGVSSICYQHGITLSAKQRAAKELALASLCILPICMQIHLAPLALVELALVSVWAWSPPKHMGSVCSKCVQWRWYICKTGTGFPHRKGSAAFRAGTRFLNPCGLSMLWFVFLWLFLVLFSAVTKVYISSFSHLCRRPNLQNGFPIWLIFSKWKY